MPRKKKEASSPPKKSSSSRQKQSTRTKQFIETLLKVSNDLVSTKSLDEALEALVAITTTSIGAERGTIFLNDADSGELYSRFAQGGYQREIRMINDSGVAGWVFQNNEGSIVNNAYDDARFNKKIDEKTGFITRNILCVPLRNLKGETIGVSQVLNKADGDFTQKDFDLLEAMTEQASVAIENNLMLEKMHKARKQELEFLNVVSQVSSEIQLRPMLQKIMATITRMLNAERSTLFLNDDATQELYTEVGQGLGSTTIRFPNHLGIAGTVFTKGKTINIPYAYADLRFNPTFDRQTGYFTRSILCVPLKNKEGKLIGVTQVLNKRVGVFSKEDEARLIAFTSQISMAIENAKLFDDVQYMKNYTENMLESMSNGVLTIDNEGKIVTCNSAGLSILHIQARRAKDREGARLIGRNAIDIFTVDNRWILKLIHKVAETNQEERVLDRELLFRDEKISVNMSILPLVSPKKEKVGTMLIIEDISQETRLRSTMSRYMDSEVALKLMEEAGDELLGGASGEGTILFSDIRNFTSLTEALGPQNTVKLLNEYFTLMVECIHNEGGMLDKFIGDAIMAVFGTPIPHEDDPDRAIRVALKMMEHVTAFNHKRKQIGKPPVNHGIGINTGHIVSGNIGSPKRMDYTVIGDSVNMASRIESLCPQYGAHILISDATYGKLKSSYRTREVDRVIVKGSSQPMLIYEVLDYHNDESYPNLVDALGYFQNGMEYYRKAQWEKGIRMFHKVLKCNPDDFCAQVYIDRCENLHANPPAEWDGIWTMRSK